MCAASKRVTATAGEKMVEQPGAGLGQFVQDERAAGQLGEDGEQAGAGRRLQHEIGGRDRGGGGGGEAERDRRRELLKRLALFGAARVGGEKARDLRQHRQHGGRRSGARAHGGTELAQEQDGRRLAGVVGGLPVPGAVGIGAAEGGLHGGAQDRRVDALAAFEMGKNEPRGLSDGGGCRRGRWRGADGGRDGKY